MIIASALLFEGSPPRMRGIPQQGAVQGLQVGITPAHAGNTNESGVYSLVFGDHPRACGEYSTQIHRCTS